MTVNYPHLVNMADGERITRKHEYAHCETCPMRDALKYKYVPSENVGARKFAVVGEAPGQEEILSRPRRPFIGTSGKLMRDTLHENGIADEDVLFTNAVACRPPDNKLDKVQGAIECCRPRLEHELKQIDPDATILIAGKVAAESTLRLTAGVRAPKKVTITRDRGQVFGVENVGTVPRRVVLTVHPAYVLRASQALPDFQADVRLLVNDPEPNPLQTPPTYKLCRTLQEVRDEFSTIVDGSWISFDVETANLIHYDRKGRSKDPLLMIGIANSTRHTTIISRQLIDNVAVGKLLRDEVAALFKRTKTVAHNGKFDMHHLIANGFTGARLDYDTMLAHGCIKETPPHGLKELGMSMYHIPNYEKELIEQYLGTDPKKRDYSKVPEDKLALYLAWDCALTWQLREDFTPRMEKENTYEWPFMNLLMPASRAYQHIEWAGIKIDEPHFEEVKKRLFTDLALSLLRLRRMTGAPDFNPRSYKQVGWMLFDKLGFKPLISKHFPERSTSAGAIKQLGPDVENHPFTVELYLYRRIAKLLSSYVLPITDLADTEGYVHPTYNLLGTETGRRSAKGPPIQTLPRAGRDEYGPLIRQGFVAAPGWKLVVGDYSQAEMRVWAHETQDPFLLGVYNAIPERDLHSEGAMRLFGPDYTKEQRTYVKNFNFAYVYGGNEYSFASQFNLPIEAARQFVNEYEKLMPVARKWRDDQFKRAMRDGFVRTIFGRKRRFPLVVRETEDEVRKTSWNMPIQSTAADLTLLAVNILVEEGWNVVLEVHDSIGIHCPDELVERATARLTEVMTSVGRKYIPSVLWKVDVDAQQRWELTPQEKHDAMTVVDLFTETGGSDSLEGDEEFYEQAA